MTHFYAAQFESGENTTTGQPNSRTGRMSKAVNLMAFSKKENRDAWVDNGKVTSDMRGNCRKATTKKEARNLHLGMSVVEFNEMLDMMLDAEELS
jgi:hypothetical protein